jgi:hypothetical protein
MDACSAEYSYQQCGGNSANFGNDVAYRNEYFGGLSQFSADALRLHDERISNMHADKGFITNAEADAAATVNFWLWYGYGPNGLWTSFNINVTFAYKQLSEPSSGLSDRGSALIQEMGRWGPVLHNTTNTMGAAALLAIAAPYVADGLVKAGLIVGAKKLLENISVDGPAPGLWHLNGRIVGVRWKKSQWGIRLDLQPMKGDPTDTPVLHVNVGSLKPGESVHIKIFDPKWIGITNK